MNRIPSLYHAIKPVILLIAFLISMQGNSMNDVTLTIKLQDVYDADIVLTAYQGQYFSKELFNKTGITNEVQFQIPAALLPGQFLLQFNYRKTPMDKKTSSELGVFLNQYNLQYTVNPAFTQYDSIIHGPDPENETFHRYMNESLEMKAPGGTIEKFLLAYDRKESKLYKTALNEYKVRSEEFNAWVGQQTLQNRALFVSSFFDLDRIALIDWSLEPEQILDQQIMHFFDFVNWSDSLLVRSQALSQFMNNYIKLFALRASTRELADSLFTQAGRIACDKAANGHPQVYGWMVDFFYMGYEQLGLETGMKMLQQHLDNPNCLTQSRVDILRRLEGMQRLVIGSIAPDFTLSSGIDGEFKLYSSRPPTPYILLLFWSADCEHCIQMADELLQWQQNSEKSGKVAVVAISVDVTPAEVAKWNELVPMLPRWVHLRAPEGLDSKIANDYVILSTPALFLLNSSDYSIAALPMTIKDLDGAITK